MYSEPMSTKRPAILVIAILALIAAPAQAKSRTITMTTLAGYASQIAGSPTTIACDSATSEGGHVQFDGVIHLDPWICKALANPLDRSQNVAYAMLALQHEATHVALNSGDEGAVECSAILNRYQLVRLFKLPAKVAGQIMNDEVTIHQTIMPPAYRTHC